jgi:hypothetical protein
MDFRMIASRWTLSSAQNNSKRQNLTDYKYVILRECEEQAQTKNVVYTEIKGCGAASLSVTASAINLDLVFPCSFSEQSFLSFLLGNLFIKKE